MWGGRGAHYTFLCYSLVPKRALTPLKSEEYFGNKVSRRWSEKVHSSVTRWQGIDLFPSRALYYYFDADSLAFCQELRPYHRKWKLIWPIHSVCSHICKWGKGLIGDAHIACRAHAVPQPCRAAKYLECVFPIWFTQCGRVWFTLAMPCPCHALTMPYFSRPRHSTAVERRPVGYLPAFGFFRLLSGVPRRLLSEAY